MGIGSELPNLFLVLCKQWIADSRCGVGIGGALLHIFLVLRKQWIADSRCATAVAGELPNLFLVLYKLLNNSSTVKLDPRFSTGLGTNIVLSKTATIFAGGILVQSLYHHGYPPIQFWNMLHDHTQFKSPT